MEDKILIQSRRVSLEMDTVGFNRIGSEVTNLLHSYISNVKTFMGDVFGSTENTEFSFSKQPRLNRLVSASNYVSMTAIKVYVPAGMDAYWLDFMDALNASQNVIDTLVEDTLKPAGQFFALLLSQPETMHSSNLTAASKVEFHDKEMAKAKAEVAKCYSKHSVSSEREYGDVFRRNADFISSQERLEELAMRLAKTPPGEVRKQMEHLSDLMDRLIIRMKQDPETYQMNGITGKALSEIALKLAEEVEFYAAHVFMVSTAVKAMKDNCDKLSKILKV